ncbi:MAG: flagellar hook-associated protein FlgK [Planctomycetaceae bacterium]|nr:flagellar hook-associated protein FlgK [Planctomycetaceae bacterium]
MGLNGALQIGRSAILTSQAAISVAGNNMANAATPGYHRQIANLTPSRPEAIGRNQFVGSGVSLVSVNRAIDHALQSRLRDAISDENSAGIDQRFLSAVETIQNELSQDDLSSRLSTFFNAFSELANNPLDNAIRTVVIQQGVSVADHVNMIRDEYVTLREESDRALGTSVDRVDGLLGEIATMNQQIAAAEGGQGGTTGGANSLRDRRDQLIDELAGFIDVTTIDQPNGAVDILVGSTPLVLAGESRGIQLRKESGPEGIEVSVRVGDDGTLLDIKSGSIGALVRQRDETVNPAIEAIDEFAGQLAFQVNRVHSQGQGESLRSEFTGSIGLADPAANLNGSYSGLPWAIENGTFEIHVVDPESGNRTTHQVAVDPQNDSMQDVVDRINLEIGGTEVSASITANGEFKIAAATGRQIAFSDDSSGFLAAVGVNGFFTGTDAADLAVAGDLLDDPSLLSITNDFTPGGNGAALAMVELEDAGIDSFGGRSLREKWQSSVNELAVRTSAANTSLESSRLVRANLDAQSQSVSGVSIDEEAIDLMTLQRQFQAAARFVSVIDEAMQTLLSIV